MTASASLFERAACPVSHVAVEDTSGASKRLSGRWHYQAAPTFQTRHQAGKGARSAIVQRCSGYRQEPDMNSNVAVLAFTIAVLGLFSSLEIIPGVGSFAASMMLVIGGTVLACQLMIRGAP